MASSLWRMFLMPSDVIRLGDALELDRRAYELRRSGRSLRLERIPMELLLLLVERRGELVTREEIIEKIWARMFSWTPTAASMRPSGRSGRL
jgi:DNA-binding winged helix-turn-helix (wHTH) protein